MSAMPPESCFTIEAALLRERQLGAHAAPHLGHLGLRASRA